MSLTQYFIILNLRCIMKGTHPSLPYRLLRFFDFLTLTTQQQFLEWIASTSLALWILQTSELQLSIDPTSVSKCLHCSVCLNNEKILCSAYDACCASRIIKMDQELDCGVSEIHQG